MSDWFADTSVMVMAAGVEHPDREPCRAFLSRVAASDQRLHVSVEAIQEFVFHRMRRVARPAAVSEAHALAGSSVLHPFGIEVLDRALVLIADSGVRGRDAVHAATALGAGFDTIVSLDADFDQVPGLRRLSPAEAG